MLMVELAVVEAGNQVAPVVQLIPVSTVLEDDKIKKHTKSGINVLTALLLTVVQ